MTSFRTSFAFLLLAVLALSAAAPACAGDLVLGAPAPDFSARTLDATKLSLADFRGQVLVINFWATWCAPCKRELPLLDSFYKLEEKNGLRVLAVTTEDSLSLAQLRPLAAALAIPMMRRFDGPYSYAHGVPMNYVIDRAGILRYARPGAFSLDRMNDILLPLLNEPPPPI
jgi:thiol-disulfide isomerase/thioredoxin